MKDKRADGFRQMLALRTAILTVYFGIMLYSGIENARAHPRCDVARTYSYLKNKYKYVVHARTHVKVSYKRDGVLFGIIDLADVKYVKWPKGRARNDSLSMSFTYDPGADCDWRPEAGYFKLVLDESVDQDQRKFIVIKSF